MSKKKRLILQGILLFAIGSLISLPANLQRLFNLSWQFPLTDFIGSAIVLIGGVLVIVGLLSS